MAARWLVKTDPRRLTFETFLDRRVVTWRSVTQPVSARHLAELRRGDDVLVYLTGAVRAVVGTARVRRGAYLHRAGAGLSLQQSRSAGSDLPPAQCGSRSETVSAERLQRGDLPPGGDVLR